VSADLLPKERGAIAFVRGIIPDKANRQRDDFYPTPPASTLALLDAERFEGDIWEPACGDGAISKILLSRGYQVISSDLIDRGYGEPNIDFLLDYRTTADNIITNPPFKFAREFVEHALGRSRRKVAMLCRLAWLEGKERRKLFLSTPLARVWVHSERVPILRNGDPMMAGGGGMIAFAWFVWDHSHKGPPNLGWL
jgi:hypothetical protein